MMKQLIVLGVLLTTSAAAQSQASREALEEGLAKARQKTPTIIAPQMRGPDHITMRDRSPEGVAAFRAEADRRAAGLREDSPWHSYACVTPNELGGFSCPIDKRR
jgi:hypothetical protein